MIRMSEVSKVKKYMYVVCTRLMSEVLKVTNVQNVILVFIHIGGVERNSHNVAFWTSNDWFIGGACGLDLISQNQRCRALSTCGKNDSWFHFVWRTFPASTIPLSLHLCFFHVDSVDWLKLNCLHKSTAFTPQSNLPSISIFCLMVRSVCWHLAFDRDILKCNAWIKKENTEFYIILNAFISHVKGVERIDHRYIKECVYFS